MLVLREAEQEAESKKLEQSYSRVKQAGVFFYTKTLSPLGLLEKGNKASNKALLC